MTMTTVYVLTSFSNDDENCGIENVSVFGSEQEAAAQMCAQYEHRQKELGNRVDLGDNAPSLSPRTAHISANSDRDHYSWEITTHRVSTPQKLCVQTPLGTLIASDTENPEYPGIAIDLACIYAGESEEIGICNVEYGERLNGKREISIATYEDMAIEDYTRYLPVDSHSMIGSEN